MKHSLPEHIQEAQQLFEYLKNLSVDDIAEKQEAPPCSENNELRTLSSHTTILEDKLIIKKLNDLKIKLFLDFCSRILASKEKTAQIEKLINALASQPKQVIFILLANEKVYWSFFQTAEFHTPLKSPISYDYTPSYNPYYSLLMLLNTAKRASEIKPDPWSIILPSIALAATTSAFTIFMIYAAIPMFAFLASSPAISTGAWVGWVALGIFDMASCLFSTVFSMCWLSNNVIHFTIEPYLYHVVSDRKDNFISTKLADTHPLKGLQKELTMLSHTELINSIANKENQAISLFDTVEETKDTTATQAEKKKKPVNLLRAGIFGTLDYTVKSVSSLLPDNILRF